MADNGKPHKEVAQGLNSPELRKNPNIPYADEIVELNNVKTEPVSKKKDDGTDKNTVSLSELRNDPNIPYVDDIDELNNVQVEPVSRKKEDGTHNNTEPLSELQNHPNIPYVGDNDELNTIRTEPVPQNIDDDSDDEETEPLLPRRDGKIHATDLGSIRSSPNSDTIVVNTPEGTLYITLDPDSNRPSTSSLKSPSTKSTNTATPSTSKVFGAGESKDLITVERGEEVTSVEQRQASLRRNSISMPTLSEIDMIRQQYIHNQQDGVSDFDI